MTHPNPRLWYFVTLCNSDAAATSGDSRVGGFRGCRFAGARGLVGIPGFEGGEAKGDIKRMLREIMNMTIWTKEVNCRILAMLAIKHQALAIFQSVLTAFWKKISLTSNNSRDLDRLANSSAFTSRYPNQNAKPMGCRINSPRVKRKNQSSGHSDWKYAKIEGMRKNGIGQYWVPCDVCWYLIG